MPQCVSWQILNNLCVFNSVGSKLNVLIMLIKKQRALIERKAARFWATFGQPRLGEEERGAWEQN